MGPCIRVVKWTRSARLVRTSGLAAAVLCTSVAVAACGSAPGTTSTSTGLRTRPAVARQYAGHVPWSSAVSSPDGRTLHLLADWDHTDGFVCDSPDERLQLIQTPTRVVLTIRAYARPLPQGVSCGGVGHSLQPHTLHLTSALGTRSLIDGGFSTRRAVLADRSIPSSRTVPPGYVAQPLTWDADSAIDRTATRAWVKIAPFGRNLPVLLQLTVGLPTSNSTFKSPAGHLIDTTTIHGAPAGIFRSDSGGQTVTTICWTTTAGQQTALRAIGTTTDHLTRTQILTFARVLAL